MNIIDYAQAKYELADILRAATVVARAREPDVHYPFEDLFARLAEDRFNIALVGQFSRGKTSLMNAIVNSEYLPTGVVPLTSVITTVQYGASPCAIIEYAKRTLPSRIPLTKLSEFVTQEHNPGNKKGIRFVRVELPAEILRQGFYLIDTPGLGSVIAENTRTTESFLPEADAVVLVSSYDSPLSDYELKLVKLLGREADGCFVVLNKADLVEDANRSAVVNYVRTQLPSDRHGRQPEIFSVSAREALIANRADDAERLLRSGLPAFVRRLENFVIKEKHAIIIHRMVERIAEELAALGCVNERKRLSDLILRLSGPNAVATRSTPARMSLPRFHHCAVCAPMEREFRRFLETFQYRIIVEERTRHTMHEQGGLCPLHVWQYAALASSHGTCVAFPGVFDRMATHVSAGGKSRRKRASDAVAELKANLDCILCRVRREAEDRAIRSISGQIDESFSCPAPVFPDICLDHLASVISVLRDEVGRRLLDAMIEAWQLTAEDMRRYALKRDGSRRALTTDDELDADLRGLRALGGHGALSFARPQR